MQVITVIGGLSPRPPACRDSAPCRAMVARAGQHGVIVPNRGQAAGALTCRAGIVRLATSSQEEQRDSHRQHRVCWRRLPGRRPRPGTRPACAPTSRSRGAGARRVPVIWVQHENNARSARPAEGEFRTSATTRPSSACDAWARPTSSWPAPRQLVHPSAAYWSAPTSRCGAHHATSTAAMARRGHRETWRCPRARPAEVAAWRRVRSGHALQAQQPGEVRFGSRRRPGRRWARRWTGRASPS